MFNDVIKTVIIDTVNGKRPRRRLSQKWIDIIKAYLEKCALDLRLDKSKDGVRQWCRRRL